MKLPRHLLPWLNQQVEPGLPRISIGGWQEPAPDQPDMIVSIGGEGETRPRWASLIESRGAHILDLRFQDNWEGIAGYPETSMTAEQMNQLLSETSWLNENHHLHLHCRAGVSRSTACAAAVMAHLSQGRRSDREILNDLFRIRPKMDPNPHVLALADAATGHKLAKTWKSMRSQRRRH